MQPPAGKDSHRRGLPPHSVADAELLHQLERRGVALADEVVKTFDRQAGKIEVRCHAARFWRSLQNIDAMPGLEGMKRRGKSHGARSDNDNTRDKTPLGE